MIRFRRFVIGGHYDGTYLSFDAEESPPRGYNLFAVHIQDAPPGKLSPEFASLAHTAHEATTAVSVIKERYAASVVFVDGVLVDVLIHEHMYYNGDSRVVDARVAKYVAENKL